MTSLLAPAYALVLGSKRWTQQVLSLDLELELAPRLDSLTVRLPRSAPFDAGLGDAATLDLDGGEGSETVFTGTIAAVEYGYDEIRVRVLDGGAALAQARPATTYEQAPASQVVTELCGDAGVDVGDLADGPTFVFYAAEPSRTAFEHIARVCAWAGAIVRFTSDGALESVVLNATSPDLALRYGRELVALRQRRLPAPVDGFVVAGESGASSASSDDALRPTTDFFGGDRPDGPGATSRWSFAPALRTATDAATAGAALKRQYAATRERGTFDAWLLPKLRPGTVLEIQDLPDGFSQGPYWIEAAAHRVTPRGATTRARYVKGGDSFDPSALAGALAGAIGGLL
ncbi:MAG TPA: hypothetical protein VIW69_08170 [Candidatus Elarobacter sp.]